MVVLKWMAIRCDIEGATSNDATSNDAAIVAENVAEFD